MKLVIIAAVVSFAPLPAAAQSLSDTHELVWNPAGKSPAAIYRMRAKPACNAGGAHHQAGKTPLATPPKCVTAKDKNDVTLADSAK
jgi:hypothetical protein